MSLLPSYHYKKNIVWHDTFIVCLLVFFSTEEFKHPFPHPTLRPIKDIKQWFCPRVFIPTNYFALTETWNHTLLPFWGQNSGNCHKCLYVRKTLCLPLLRSFGSLPLLILCIENHPKAKIYLLVLQLSTKLKLADGFNVLHMDINLQKVPKYTPSSHSFRDNGHSKKMEGGRNTWSVYICVNTEYNYFSRVIPFRLMLFVLCVWC